MHLTLPPNTRRRRTGAAGFTMVEALVVLTVVGLLLAAAAPDFAAWVRNARIRTAAQALQDGLRLAQAEATRRNRQVVFALITGSVPAGTVPSTAITTTTSGINWMIYTLPLLGFENPELIQPGAIADSAPGALVGGPAAICFNSAGRQVANPSIVLSGACTVNTATPLTRYDVTAPNADRPLRVTVSLAGQVRVCDPARTQSATAADGCP